MLFITRAVIMYAEHDANNDDEGQTRHVGLDARSRMKEFNYNEDLERYWILQIVSQTVENGK